MSVMDALVHPYIDEGRLRYHSCMCKCCFTVPLTGLRHFCMDYEPVAPQTFDDKWEKKMSNVQQVKGMNKINNIVEEGGCCDYFICYLNAISTISLV